MASAMSVQVTWVSDKGKAKNRSSGLLGKNLYAIFLDVLPVVKDKVLFSIN